MRLIFHYMRENLTRICFTLLFKSSASMCELLIPYILEHIIDKIIPTGQIKTVIFWGLLMIFAALLVRTLNVTANRLAVRTARNCILKLRDDLFKKTLSLSGRQFDTIGLPSLTSRMTSDSYNVQNFMVVIQAMGIRAPVLLFGGIIVTLTMSARLAMILLCMIPVLGTIVFIVTRKGIPLYERVQKGMDDVVRIMRENITGIRVVKALSKEDHERARFDEANKELTSRDLRAGITMASPFPIMNLFLNCGLVLVVLYGSHLVNDGKILPGVILAFLTYFNMILQGVMGVNRLFLMSSKATASADRISAILDLPEDLTVDETISIDPDRKDPCIHFDHVSFGYHTTQADKAAFNGEQQELCLSDIDFTVNRGESLGIIGATGSGKSTIIRLLLRFYDCNEGTIEVDGRDIKTYDKDDLRGRFGMVFQNDVIFNDTLRQNISFGRDISEEDIKKAAQDAGIAETIENLPGSYDYMADFKGANLSGGQKQRILIARALAANPEILILDDASSALDYKTDAALRKAIREHHSDSTLIMIAQRISSVMNLTNILVLEDGKIIGYGNHESLMQTCAVYREIYESQMGDVK